MKAQLRYKELTVGEDLGQAEYTFGNDDADKRANAADMTHPWYISDSPFGGRLLEPSVTCDDYVRLFREKYSSEALAGAIHAKCKAEFINPIRVACNIIVRGRIKEKYTKRGRLYLVVETVTSEKNGPVLARGENVIVVPKEE